MAVFRDDTDDFQRLDYALLKNGATKLYYRLEFLAEDVEWLSTHDYRIDKFDCAVWKTEDDMYSGFATMLGFPDYFGRNLAALNDCLSDIEVPEKGGRVLVFHHYDAFAAILPEIAWHILDNIEIRSRHYLLFGKRLLSLVQSDDPRVKFNDLGVQQASWNRRE